MCCAIDVEQMPGLPGYNTSCMASKLSTFYYFWYFLRDVQKLLKIILIFPRKICQKFRKRKQSAVVSSNLKNSLDWEGILKWNENFWKFWRKLIAIYRKIQDNQQLMNTFHRASKIKKPACKTLRVFLQERRKFWKIARKFWNYWLKSLWKIHFSLFLLNISGISASSQKVYTPER